MRSGGCGKHLALVLEESQDQHEWFGHSSLNGALVTDRGSGAQQLATVSVAVSEGRDTEQREEPCML